MAEAPGAKKNSSADKDVEIIRNVLSVQHVPVVGTLGWDKLQFLLQSLCDRISLQAARLEKAEEQGKSLASVKDELNLLRQNALTAANADKAAEAEKQAEADKQEKFWNLIESRLKELETSTAPLKVGQMPELVALPNRMSILEESTQSLESHVHDMDSQVAQLDTDLHELDADFTAKEAHDGAYNSQELTERIKLLEAQAEEFRQLMQQVTKAQTADLEAIQKTQRTLRADLEAKPLAQTEGGNEGISEFQKRLERKADVDTVNQLLRASTNTKEVLETLAKAIDELKKGIKRSSRFSVKIDGPILPTGRDVVSELTNVGAFEAHCMKLEEELVALANKLSAKADRAAIDEIQFKLASGGTEGWGGGDGTMKDLIAKKADRTELLELFNSTRGSANQVESLTGLYKELKEKLNTLGSSVTALAERSDLAVLLAKRAEQITNPVASLQGGVHTDDEEIQFVVNEHANRIMVYADMLLQMQVVLATKADNTTLTALRDLVEKSKGGDGGGDGKAALEAAHAMRETLMSHEKMLMKLLEDVVLLEKDVLIMSGHNDNYQKSSISESPISIEGGTPLVSPQAPPTSELQPPSLSPTSKEATKQATLPSLVPPPSTLLSALVQPAPYAIEPSFAVTPAVADEVAPYAQADPINVEDSSHMSQPSATRRRSGSPGPPNGAPRGSRLGGQASHSGNPTQKGSNIRITNVQEETQAVAQSKYHETLGVLEEVLNDKKIEPKENVAVLKKLIIEIEKMSMELENNLALLDSLEENKADKVDLQALAKLVKELKVHNAMLSGKPLLGFKCMSCNHDLEKLNPNRSPHIPTGVMPRSFLSMLSAERIFSPDKRDGSPPRTSPRTPPCDRTGDFVKIAKKPDSGGSHPLKRSQDK